MKPAIAYGILGSQWSDRWEIIAITSEKGGRRGMVYGRDKHGAPTHAKPEDVHGRFAELEQAEIAREAIWKLHVDHQPGIKAAEVALAKLRSARTDAIAHALEQVRVHRIDTETAA